MRKIVIKMRSYKKLINQDLLHLALIISLLKVDPDSYFGHPQPYVVDSGGGVMLGEAWQPHTFPSFPYKDASSFLERYQEDILEELNTLGSFNRFSLYGDTPVQLSAYLVDTEQHCMDQDDHTDSDSGISDTEHVGSPCSGAPGSPDRPDSPRTPADLTRTDTEAGWGEMLGGLEDLQDFQEFYEDEMLDLEAGTELTFSEVEYGPHIPEELAQAGIPELEDHGAIQYELLHMEEQLLNLDYNIEDLDEAFIKMDEEIAKTISEDDLIDQEMGSFDDEMFERPNPFDAWEREAYSAIPELLQLDAILAEPFGATGAGPEALHALEEDIARLGSLEGLDALDQFNLDMLEDQQDLLTEDEILRNDVMFSRARDTGDLNSTEGDVSGAESDVIVNNMISSNIHQQVFSPETFVRGKSEEEDEEEEDITLDSFDMVEDERKTVVQVEDLLKQEIKQQEDLMAKVLKESGILEEEEDEDEVQVLEQPEPEKVKPETIKVEDEDDEEVLHEEILDVVSAEQFQMSLQTTGGACAQVDLLYGERPGKPVPNFSLSYQPFFNWEGFHNDHGSYIGTKLEAADIKLEPGLEPPTGLERTRRRNESESSGYYSSEDTRSTRDEKLATKMGLPYSVRELINCPVDRFNEILSNPVLTHQQVKVCKDIRRRGKNKVAAQNCRKRKLETIEELQVQVESVRRRREQLLREREQLEQERRRWSSKLVRIEQFVLAGIGKNIAEFTLQVIEDRVELTARVGGAVGGVRGRGGRSRL